MKKHQQLTRHQLNQDSKGRMKKTFTLSGLATESDAEEVDQGPAWNNNSHISQQIFQESLRKVSREYVEQDDEVESRPIHLKSLERQDREAESEEHLQFQEYRAGTNPEEDSRIKRMIVRDFEAAAAKHAEERRLREYYENQLQEKEQQIQAMYKMIDQSQLQASPSFHESQHYFRPQSSKAQNSAMTSSIITSSNQLAQEETEKIIAEKDQKYEELLEKYQNLTEVLREKNDEIARYRYQNYRLQALIDSFEQQTYLQRTKQSNKRLTQQFIGLKNTAMLGSRITATNQQPAFNRMQHSNLANPLSMSTIGWQPDYRSTNNNNSSTLDNQSIRNIQDLQKRLNQLRRNRIQLELNKSRVNKTMMEYSPKSSSPYKEIPGHNSQVLWTNKNPHSNSQLNYKRHGRPHGHSRQASAHQELPSSKNNSYFIDKLTHKHY